MFKSKTLPCSIAVALFVFVILLVLSNVNRKVEADFAPGPPPSSCPDVIINEFAPFEYPPATDSEWVELLNRTDQPINLDDGWILRDYNNGDPNNWKDIPLSGTIDSFGSSPSGGIFVFNYNSYNLQSHLRDVGDGIVLLCPIMDPPFLSPVLAPGVRYGSMGLFPNSDYIDNLAKEGNEFAAYINGSWVAQTCDSKGAPNYSCATITPTLTPSPSPTSMPTPTSVPTPSLTPTSSPAQAPTATPTAVPTFTPSPTRTPIPTAIPTSTPTPSPASTAASGSSTDDADVDTATSNSTTPASAPVCGDAVPGGAPKIIRTVAGANSVLLQWEKAPDPVTYYLVAYGTKSGEYLYGNPNVGGKSATSYRVSNLSGGTTYYFVVRAGNGCGTGPFSNEVSATPPGFLLNIPATGFYPNVLGAKTDIEASPEAYPKIPTPSVIVRIPEDHPEAGMTGILTLETTPAEVGQYADARIKLFLMVAGTLTFAVSVLFLQKRNRE